MWLLLSWKEEAYLFSKNSLSCFFSSAPLLMSFHITALVLFIPGFLQSPAMKKFVFVRILILWMRTRFVNHWIFLQSGNLVGLPFSGGPFWFKVITTLSGNHPGFARINTRPRNWKSIGLIHLLSEFDQT